VIPSKHETLGSNPSAIKKKKKKERERERVIPKTESGMTWDLGWHGDSKVFSSSSSSHIYSIRRF
jgi:hypothetical protein